LVFAQGRFTNKQRASYHRFQLGTTYKSDVLAPLDYVSASIPLKYGGLWYENSF